MATCKNILLVEEDAALRDFLAQFFQLFRPDFGIAGVDKGTTVIERLCQGSVDIIIANDRLPQAEGWGFIRHIQHEWPETSIILMTRQWSTETLQHQSPLELAGFVGNPFNPLRLLWLVDQALARLPSLA